MLRVRLLTYARVWEELLVGPCPGRSYALRCLRGGGCSEVVKAKSPYRLSIVSRAGVSQRPWLPIAANSAPVAGMRVARAGHMSQRPRRLTLALGALTVLLTSQQAFAATIVILADQREVRVGNDFIWRNVTGSFSESITREPSGHWGYGSASQNTIRTLSFMGGTGSSSAEMAEGFPEAAAGSHMGVSFMIDAPYLADLAVELAVTGPGIAATALLVTNENPFYSLWVDRIFDGTTSVTRQAILQPGRYHFELGARNNLFGDPNASGLASFAGGLTLTPLNSPPVNPTPVPEPGTMLLIGTGLLIGVRKMRQRP